MTKDTLVSKFLREPLFHFLLIGAGLFFLFSQLNSDSESIDKPQITINKSTLLLLTDKFTEENGKAPTEKELKKLLEEKIEEQVLYHEALTMGLDKNDVVIQHRLAQKMKYLFEDITLDDDFEKDNEAFYTNLKNNYHIVIDEEIRNEFNISAPKQ
ncbi:MAG: Unknown protein [uncultured Sulfurovum sp.]|uniref:Uncharacterized protein n=1 Tax=uncultured Sulfurovum sp. TaxID=269237 RepID=A0A6S6T4U6_9BACT|nr:MAG: Unknown protein [uncultured Sulfurovum sp.]